jgi:hypothetical protein
LKADRNAEDEKAVGGNGLGARAHRLAAIALDASPALGSGKDSRQRRGGEKQDAANQARREHDTSSLLFEEAPTT